MSAKFYIRNSLTSPWLYFSFPWLSKYFCNFFSGIYPLKSEIFEIYQAFDTFSTKCFSHKKYPRLHCLLILTISKLLREFARNMWIPWLFPDILLNSLTFQGIKWMPWLGRLPANIIQPHTGKAWLFEGMVQTLLLHHVKYMYVTHLPNSFMLSACNV